MYFHKGICLLVQLTVIIFWTSVNEAQATEYIVGGTNAAPGEIPYQISLQYNRRHNCGGSVISPCIILTAAHCVKGFSTSALSVLAGTTTLNKGGVRVAVNRTIPHKNYKNTYINDIALVVLQQCLNYSETIQPVRILTSTVDGGDKGVVSGWGYINQAHNILTNDLKKLTVNVISNQECRTRYTLIDDGNLCALNKPGQGFCQGDSGGPLVEQSSGLQIGLVSANIPCAHGRPDIYTRLSYFTQWIANNIPK